MYGGTYNDLINLARIEEIEGRDRYGIWVSETLYHGGTIIVGHLLVPLSDG